jgi:hypothetical protein
MTKTMFVAAVLMLGSAAPALAQSACTEPATPAAVDGATASADEIRAGIAAAKSFIAQSDVYQECLGKEVEAAKAQAAADKKPFDQSIADAAMAKAETNQKAKEKVGADINASIGVYKKAHASK